jgi:Protein of unknown function (DUF4242)
MPRFLIESYTTGAAVSASRDRARLTARLGSGVRYVRSTFLPADETVMHVFEAPSAEALGEAGRRAALDFQRIVEAVEASPAVEDER